MRRQAGFTLVELIIAMAIFAAALSVITISFVGLVRIQRSAASDRATLENGRRIIDSMVGDIRSSGTVEVCTNPIGGVTGSALVVNNGSPTMYFVYSDKTLQKWSSPPSDACSAGSVPAPGSSSDVTQLTSNGVTVSNLVLLMVDYGTGKSLSVDIDLRLHGQGNVEDHIHTAATTRGSGGGG